MKSYFKLGFYNLRLQHVDLTIIVQLKHIYLSFVMYKGNP